jgi:autoinducer 2 (AI-2) kinase
MSAHYLIGLDVGGGGGRCLIVDTASGETRSVFRPWSLSPDPAAGGFAYRMDPDVLWKTLCGAVREALRQGGIQPGEVAGIAATSMRHTTVVLDREGGVLLMTPNRDARAAAQGMQLAAERGEELQRITGHAPSPIFLAARLLWLKENDSLALRTAAAAMSISDWVGYKMSGEKASEYAQAGESLLLDLEARNWSKAILRSLDIPEKLLPPLKAAGARLGRLTKEAAADLGLAAGIPVAVGGPDTQCGLLGAGVVSGGMTGVIAGTTTPIQLVTDRPVFDASMRLWTGLHVIPGLYVLESNAGQMGATLDWLARLVHAGAPNPVARLAAEAEASRPGAHGMRSNIGAAIFNAAAMEPPVDTLTFSSVVARGGEEGRADLARAVLEGMAYAVRANFEQILEVSAAAPGEVHVTGGISRSPLWTRLLSEVLDRPVLVSASAEATALGAAICAGMAAGLFKDLASGAQALGRDARRHQPGPDSAAYQELYAGWLDLLSARRPADAAAAGQITETMMAGMQGGEEGARPASIRPRIYIGAEVDEAALQRLGGIGEVTYRPYRTEGILLTGDDLVQTLQGYQVFVTEVDIVDAEALLKLPDLRLIVVCRGNPVNIDIPACTLAGVPVTNTPARNADAVADLALGFLLMLARRLQPASAFLHQPGGEAGDLGRMGQAHEEFLGVELWRKTVGLVGGGAIGRKVAARILPFGARLLVYDPFLSEDQVTCMGAVKVGLEQLLAESDFISLHAAVTDATRGMLDAAAFARMKPGAFLVNTARAALIDQPALLSALQSGRLGGFATDVFPVEPPGADDPLLAFPNVIATPHMGGNTLEVAAHQGEIIADELGLLLTGRRPKYLLNPAVMDGFAWSGARQMDEARLRQHSAGPGPGATDLDVASHKEKAAEIPPVSIPAAASQPAVKIEEVQNMDSNDSRQKMNAILSEFTARIAADKEMADFAKGKNVVFLFTVKDLDLAFFLSFVDGQVGAGLQAPPREPDVKLKMAADILDGMFTGRVNATKAATSGKLSFSGDTGKAMAFMRIQGNMSRLYSEARQKVGDPGDLTRLGAAPVPAPAPAPAAAPAPVAPPAAPAPAADSAGRQKMTAILQEFTASIRSDKGMADFAKGKNVVFLFTVKDIDLAFFLSFIDGKVDAGLQTPPREPDVKLKMAADILDGMFTERINATKAATSGKLSFSGDTGKAMAFMRIQKEMGRLYGEARQKVGDPGDLTRIGATPAPVPVAAPAAPAAQANQPVAYAMPVPAVPKTGDVRDQILQVTNELYAKGLITATGGNVSARCDDNPNEIWITPSAIFKGDLRPDMMVRIDLDGRILGETDYSASSERRVHCAIYKDMPDVSAVVHSHAEQATLMALTGTKFQPISADAAFFGDIPVVPFIMPGTDELGNEVAKAMLTNGIAVLMQNHGLVVAGSSLRRAADMTEIIEVTAHKLLTCRLLGIDPALLPEETVRTLKEIGASMA